jgi:hypothetical protein
MTNEAGISQSSKAQDPNLKEASSPKLQTGWPATGPAEVISQARDAPAVF